MEPDRCSAASVGLEEPLAGTASRVVRWVAIEQPGAWGADALVESRLDEEVGRTIQSASRRHGFRALLIRRPGWRKPEGTRRVFLARTRPDGGWCEELEVEHARQILDLDWAVLDAAAAPGLGRPGPPSLHLVCTNGRHDPCCADQGRPVVRALDEAGAGDVWESSHVGGDRFAANIVCLPTGVYFGRVQPEEAAGLLDDFGRGLLRLDRYRGRSCFPSLVQAAEVFLRCELDERRLEAVRVVTAKAQGGHRMAVELESDGDRYRVVVRRERSDRQLLSCGATPSPPWRYRLESLSTA